MAKRQKIGKGEHGYLQQKKTGALLHTLLMVAIGVAIFVLGLFLNKMEPANVFTVAAILFVLPAAKAFVNVIVLFPYRPLTAEQKERLASYAREEDEVLYDVVFTSSERVMHLDCIYVTGHQVLGYTSRKKDNVKVMEDYLKKEFTNRQLSFVVYIATEEKQVADRMKLRGEEAETQVNAQQEVVELLKVFTI